MPEVRTLKSMWRQMEQWLEAFQDGWPRSRWTPWVLLSSFVIAISLQAECEAKRVLHIEEGYAAEDAAKHAGKKLEYGIYGPGRVVDK